MVNTPLLFMVFNRPEKTARVFEVISKMKPSKLYVACDGPREEIADDKEKVLKTREIVTTINWPCEIKTLFSEYNLGCRKGCEKALNWFFENEEKGIILEDDCLPHKDFFSFCENLLEYYSDNEKVSFISGNNFQNGKLRGTASYYFSKYLHLWGWATWKRSWKKYYNEDMSFWPEWSKSGHFKKIMHDKTELKYWKNIFNIAYENKIDTWDYPLLSNMFYKGALTAIPNVNLVTNIGFDSEATHTKSKDNINSNLLTYEIKILNHPEKIERDIEADIWTFNNHFGGKNLRFPYKYIFYVKRILKNILKKIK